MKARLLFVVEAMGGGLFTYIVELANKLTDKYEVFIAHGLRPQTPKDYADYFDDRIHLIRVESFDGISNHPLRAFKAVSELKRIAVEVKPDVIHMHSSVAGAVGRIAFRHAGMPKFYTPHGYSFLMSNYSFLKRTVFHSIEKLCAKTDCTTISCSEGEHRETLKLTRRAEYIDNGVSIDELDRMLGTTLNGESSQKHPVFFTIGRICYQKGSGLFNQIAEQFPDVHFVWIGDGEEKDLLTSANIEVTGWLTRSEVIRRASDYDVFLLTSLWEGMPMSLLEMMYLKKLCIVSNSIGNRDVIRDGKNGFLCSDAEAFIKRMEEYLRDQIDTQSITDEAQKDILSRYNTNISSQKYAALYDRAMRSA